jgi:hypothetical protein
MKRREVMQIVGKTLGGLFVAQFVPGCKPPSGPSPIPPKPPDPINYYHFEITYIRVAIRDKNFITFIPLMKFGYPDGFALATLLGPNIEKIDNFTFRAFVPNELAAGFYCVAVDDLALNDGIDKGTCVTGIRIKIRVVETNTTYELSSIVPNVFNSLTYSTSISTMARFFLKGDGTIEDY